MYKVDFLIITPKSEERRALLSKFVDKRRSDPTNEDGNAYYTATVPYTTPGSTQGSYSIVVTRPLIQGQIAAADMVRNALDTWMPRFVLLVGIAGEAHKHDAAQPQPDPAAPQRWSPYRRYGREELWLGDILLANQIVYYEQGRSSERPRYQVDETVRGPLLSQAQAFADEDTWHAGIETQRPATGGRKQPRCIEGTIASGEKVIDNFTVANRIADDWLKLIGVETEGYAVATAVRGHKSKPGFLMLRSVSDFADNQKYSEKTEAWRDYALDNVATFTMAFLSSGPVPPAPTDQAPPKNPTLPGGGIVTGDIRADGGATVTIGGVIINTPPQHDPTRILEEHRPLNPFMGLVAYGYDTRDRYAGRQIDRPVTELVNSRQSIFFVVGPSGSGKSSLVLAGLLPALQKRYEDQGYGVRLHNQQRTNPNDLPITFRPGKQPINALIDELCTLGLPAHGREAELRMHPHALTNLLREHTSSNERVLVVLDQFEEIFSINVSRAERSAFFDLLEVLPGTIEETRTQFLITMRSDFLTLLWEETKTDRLRMLANSGIALREPMSSHELQAAICAPIDWFEKTYQTKYCIEGTLITQLTHEVQGETERERVLKRPDAVATQRVDPACLPLLQKTLYSLWDDGDLSLSNYLSKYKTITAAMNDEAKTVLQSGKSDAERQEMLNLLLDLVEVSIDDKDRRAVRRRRELLWLEARYSSKTIEHLEGFVQARLVSKRAERIGDKHIVVVDLIHDRLITDWDLLRSAVEDNYLRLKQLSNFEQKLREWLIDRTLLLEGRELDQANKIDEADLRGLAQGAEAIEFRSLSNAKRQAAEQERAANDRSLRTERTTRRAWNGALGIGLGYGMSFAYYSYLYVVRAGKDTLLHPFLYASFIFVLALVMGTVIGVSTSFSAARFWNHTKPNYSWVLSLVAGSSISAFFNIVFVSALVGQTSLDILLAGALIGMCAAIGALLHHWQYNLVFCIASSIGVFWLAQAIGNLFQQLFAIASSPFFINKTMVEIVLAGLLFGSATGIGFVSSRAQPALKQAASAVDATI